MQCFMRDVRIIYSQKMSANVQMHSGARTYSHEFLSTIYYRAPCKYRAYAAWIATKVKTTKMTRHGRSIADGNDFVEIIYSLGKFNFDDAMTTWRCNNSSKISDIDFLTPELVKKTNW